MGGAYKHVFAM